MRIRSRGPFIMNPVNLPQNRLMRILLVEDSLSDAELLLEMLRRTEADSFQFTWVERLDDALARLREEPFDALLLDLSLPDSAGPETFRRARRHAPQVPIVVLTGATDESVGLAALHEGIQDYLVKGQADSRQIARALRYAIERKQAEDQRRRQQEWLRVTLTSIGDAVITSDTDGRITFLNPVAAALTGWAPEEAMGQPIQSVFRILNEQTFQPAEDLIAHVLNEKRVLTLTNPTALLTRDGRHVPIEDSAAPILDAAGQVAGVVLVFHDVSEKQRAHAALCEAQQLSQALNRINQTLHASLDPGEIMQRLVTEGAAALGTETAAVSLRQAGHWTVRHVHGFPNSLIGAKMNDDEERHAMLAIRTRQPVAIADTFNDERVNRDHTRKYNVRAVLVAPLIVRNEPFGVIFFNHHAARRPFSEAQVQFAAQLAATASIALENGRLFDERKRAEELLQRGHDQLEQQVAQRTAELRRANQTLRMISECDQALVHEAGEHELIQKICHTIIEIGGYRMAWVGFAEHDSAKTVRPIAAVGFEEGYLDRVRISWADDEFGRGPTGTAIRTGKTCICDNFLTDPRLAPWREQALRRGFRSSIALPLGAAGGMLGALTIYASEPGFFDADQAGLLRELADDLAFGIAALRAHRERDGALCALQKSNASLAQRTEQLRGLALELTQVEERERRQLATVLHDHLQQLLVSAKFNLDILRKQSKTAVTQSALQQVTQLLNESIQASRSLTLELSPPVLYEGGLAPALEWLGRWMHQKHRLNVHVHLETGTPAAPEEEEVRVLLFQSVRELLFNVVKHARVKTARVQIRCPSADQVQIEVSDQGAGFDPARVTAAGASAGGFGLFSIRERLDLLGGRLDIQSAPGKGSRFTLVAPMHRLTRLAESPSPAPSTPLTPPRKTPPPRVSAPPGTGSDTARPIRVLLVDDHVVMRQGLARLLEQETDIQIVGEASDGRQALDRVRELQPEVVLMDVSMPGLNGIDATRLVKADFPHIRVIGLSMHEEADRGQAMRAAGASTYLNKAGPSDALIAAIRAAVQDQAPLG